MLYLFLTGYDIAAKNGQVFSTKDSDNDTQDKNCADNFKGGWWYTACYHANTNGYYLGNKSGKGSIYWLPWKSYQSMKTAVMMIRRKSTN